MIITLSGMHGVGKTTLVNNLFIGEPLTKVVDTDIIPIDGRGYRQQIMRIQNYVGVFIPPYIPIINTIVDRSPLDFKVYNDLAMKVGSEEWYTCDRATDQLISDFVDWKDEVEWKNILVYDDYSSIKRRILKRNRNRWGEDDEIYNRAVYRMFYSEQGNYFTALTGIPSILVHIDDVEDYIKTLFY